MISQSEHAFNAIHCFSIHYKYLTFKTDYETPKRTEANNCFDIIVQALSNSVINSVNKESSVHSLYNCSADLYHDEQEVYQVYSIKSVKT